MKNVTITLDERLAKWARVEAAKAGKSLSRWIGDLVSHARNGSRSPERSRAGVAEKLLVVGRRTAARPTLDARTPDEILYDERGLPR